MIKSYGYFTPALLLLLVEILIAVYVHDRFIRPYGGDFLIVIMIYCFVQSVLKTSVFKTAIGVLLFAYVVEFLQHFHLTKIFGWQHSRAAELLLGHAFSWVDILCYTLGIILVIIIEKLRINNTNASKPVKII